MPCNVRGCLFSGTRWNWDNQHWQWNVEQHRFQSSGIWHNILFELWTIHVVCKGKQNFFPVKEKNLGFYSCLSHLRRISFLCFFLSDCLFCCWSLAKISQKRERKSERESYLRTKCECEQAEDEHNENKRLMQNNFAVLLENGKYWPEAQHRWSVLCVFLFGWIEKVVSYVRIGWMSIVPVLWLNAYRFNCFFFSVALSRLLSLFRHLFVFLCHLAGYFPCTQTHMFWSKRIKTGS